MELTRVYEEIIDFLAGGFTPDSLIAYRPSEEAKTRVEDLIRREKNEGLTREETSGIKPLHGTGPHPDSDKSPRPGAPV